MKILNLYAGIGGNRKLWGDEHEITAVENDPNIAKIYQEFFPNDTVIVGDAHKYLLEHYKEFDFIGKIFQTPDMTQQNKDKEIDEFMTKYGWEMTGTYRRKFKSFISKALQQAREEERRKVVEEIEKEIGINTNTKDKPIEIIGGIDKNEYINKLDIINKLTKNHEN